MENGFALGVDGKDSTMISLQGEINASTVLDFKSRIQPIAENSNKDITLNCKDLTYIDSLGLSVFVNINNEMKKKNLNLKLINVNKTVMKLLKITYIDQFIKITS